MGRGTALRSCVVEGLAVCPWPLRQPPAASATSPSLRDREDLGSRKGAKALSPSASPHSALIFLVILNLFQDPSLVAS